ncbi:uncharacterized protein PAC_07098 [Phialocephala subalpina]|uniref:Uncharacterized protein n=1 Tax=Phialocephala subalpina TaxID=576137 RepID=A0A1L7WWS1_9HELO|nr:uncharacterized protein PAC_07098 [Phialocephala subalpina]
MIRASWDICFERRNVKRSPLYSPSPRLESWDLGGSKISLEKVSLGWVLSVQDPANGHDRRVSGTAASLTKAAEDQPKLKNQDDTIDLHAEAVPGWMCNYPGELPLLAEGYFEFETPRLMVSIFHVFVRTTIVS